MSIIDEYHSRFYVNAGSPSGLSWLNDRYSGGFGGGRIIAKAGDMVGHLRKDGYYSTYINGKEYICLHKKENISVLDYIEKIIIKNSSIFN